MLLSNIHIFNNIRFLSRIHIFILCLLEYFYDKNFIHIFENVISIF